MVYTLDRLLDFVTGNATSTIHLVDVENLAGAGKLSRLDVAAAKDRYLRTVRPSEGDLIVVAAGPVNKQAVFEGWPKATYRFKKGPSGADLALVEFFESLVCPGKFEHVYVASGDACLLPVAEKAAILGSEVYVVAQSARCSRRFHEYSFVSLAEQDCK